MVASPFFDRSTTIWISPVSPTATKQTERPCRFHSILISQTMKCDTFSNR